MLAHIQTRMNNRSGMDWMQRCVRLPGVQLPRGRSVPLLSVEQNKFVVTFGTGAIGCGCYHRVRVLVPAHRRSLTADTTYPSALYKTCMTRNDHAGINADEPAAVAGLQRRAGQHPGVQRTAPRHACRPAPVRPKQCQGAHGEPRGLLSHSREAMEQQHGGFCTQATLSLYTSTPTTQRTT